MAIIAGVLVLAGTSTIIQICFLPAEIFELLHNNAKNWIDRKWNCWKLRNKIINKSEQYAYLHWTTSVEWRYLGKCGSNYINQRTRQDTDWVLNVVHAQLDNTHYILPNPTNTGNNPYYQNPTNTGKNPSYLTGSTQVSRESIKDTWESDQLKFVTHNNFQHVIKKQIISAFLPEFLEGKSNWRKLFVGVLSHEFMK